MRDVVPPNERSIRNIPVPAHRKRPMHEEIEQELHEREMAPAMEHPQYASHEYSSDEPIRRPKSGRNSLILWILSAAVIGVLLAVLLSYLFAGATVTVTPKRETAPANVAIAAKLDAPLGTLPYQTLTQSTTVSRTVPTSGEAPVSRRASGTITVSNTFSTDPQRLIKNTRFEAANGKIYRIDNSIDIPGGKKQADGSIAPGVVDVQVFADSPGPDYNQAPTTFTIPGFKGDPRYTKFSGQSKTPLADGFVGTEKVVSDTDLKAAKDSIAGELSTKLVDVLKQNIPDGFVYVTGSERIATEDLPRTGDASSGAVISVKGTATGAIIKSEYLAAAMLKASSKDYNGEAVYFVDQSKVEAVASAPLAVDLRGDLTVSLKSATDVLWQYDQEAMKTALVGIPVSNLKSAMEQFKPAVDQATVSLRPVWASTFPKEAAKITVTTKK